MNACVHKLDSSFYSHGKEWHLQGVESEPLLTSRKKFPQLDSSKEGQTRDAASRWVASPTHNQPSYSAPDQPYNSQFLISKKNSSEKDQQIVPQTQTNNILSDDLHRYQKIKQEEQMLKWSIFAILTRLSQSSPLYNQPSWTLSSFMQL